MICLGIESTAHTFAVGIVEKKGKKYKILADVRDSYSGVGLVPSELAEHHFDVAAEVVKKALREANLEIKEIDRVAFARGPGIGHALRVGAIVARSLAYFKEKDLFGVNHCIAHIEIGKHLCKVQSPLVLYISGGNTQLLVEKKGHYKIIGETLDIGIGNFLDSFGRKLGLEFPAGPKLDKLYFRGKKLIELPYTVKGMDLAFSGLLTATIAKINKEKNRDLIYSALHTAFSMIAEVSERALAYTNKKELLAVGGVASSKALTKILRTMCKERGAEYFVPEPRYCTDNGVMIALAALIDGKAKRLKIEESNVIQKMRTEE
ncbi:MAG: tRNA (adenosine(37)-N6)-threonylcarbamoyltransferase complex transferase subunit TsaD [Candidatus Diapherotrites archaeon]|nr:tRNA (adenosine(37)-N6)-threonylcarbamoyltransferase complex transferase subunit TsaD [Candidatus Diapherotrites archaeon]